MKEYPSLSDQFLRKIKCPLRLTNNFDDFFMKDGWSEDYHTAWKVEDQNEALLQGHH
jgi:hypothetical protein